MKRGTRNGVGHMTWRRGKYYVKSVRDGRTVKTVYHGSGLVGQLAAQLDDAERQQRAAQRAQQQAEIAEIAARTALPAAVADYCALLAELVRQLLESAGYHQHKRQWRKRRMANDLAKPAPTRAEFGILLKRVAAGGSDADATALRTMVAAYPEYGRAFDLSEKAIGALIAHMPADPAGRAIARGRVDVLRKELGGDAPTAIERLLVDAVVQSYLDVWLVEYQCSDLWSESPTAIAFWEKRRTQAQKRYLRAVETLARVRRLLNLTVQVNIAEQQVNIAGAHP